MQKKERIGGRKCTLGSHPLHLLSPVALCPDVRVRNPNAISRTHEQQQQSHHENGDHDSLISLQIKPRMIIKSLASSSLSL